MAFAIELSPVAREHLKAFRKRDQQILVDAMTTQLTHQPNRPTRNRKQLQPNSLAPWELRVGTFRVFYDVNTDAERVIVVAVGQKSRNILRIGGEEIQL
jgi:mRNA-degrading endonuclease RelE of RelBE toxin-antitoxin system